MKDISARLPDQSRIRHSFRRGLGSYHHAASVQARIAARLAQLLAEGGAPQRFDTALEFGCGTGHLTARLGQRFRLGQLLLNDLVPEAEMALSAVSSQDRPQARFAAGAIETLALPPQLELIASASTVQWIADLPTLLVRLRDHLAPGGWLLLSGFGRRHFHELAALGSAAAAPRYLDAPDWPAVLPQGLELLALEQQPQVLHFDGAMPLLKHLRQTGVNGHAQQGWSRRQLRNFEERYRARFGADGQLPLTYDPVLLLARKAR